MGGDAIGLGKDLSAITMILCFLHWVLMLWDHCTKNRPLRAEVTDRAWGVYHAARTFRPAHLNGFQYHGNWLQNLLVAASLGGRRAST
jgi:hypothetical protein